MPILLIIKLLRYHILYTHILKCGFLTEGIELTRLEFFDHLRYLSFEVPRFRPFRQVRYANLQNTSKAMKQEILEWLVTLVKFCYKTCCQRGVFPLPCCPWAALEGLNEIRTAISSDNIQLLQSCIATYRKRLEVVLFVEQASCTTR